MAEQRTDREQFSELFGEARKRLIAGVASGLGGKATDAVRLTPDDEIEEWRRPTSPAAQLVLERGGTLEEAERANSLWAQQLRREQAQIRAAGQQAGQTPEQIHQQLTQAGRTDDAIFKECMAQAWELGRANGKGDPKTTAEYHERVLKRLRERQQPPEMTYRTVPSAGEEATDAAVSARPEE